MAYTNGSKKILGIILAVYCGLALLIYVAAFPQFRYTEVTGKTVKPSLVIGEITDGKEITQTVKSPADRLMSMAFYAGTYDRANKGIMILTLVNEQGEVIAEEKQDISSVENNRYTTIRFSSPVRTRTGEMLTLSVKTEGCESGSTITVYAGTVTEIGEPGTSSYGPADNALLGGEAFEGMLCVRLAGRNNSDFYITFWIIVLAVLAAAFLLCFVWRRQAEKGKNNPLVMVCTLFTRYQLLFRQLVSRDFKAKYKRSALGLIWSFLNPLLTMIVQYIVFSTLFNSDIEKFPVYLLIGIVFFNYFNEAVSMGMTSITGNASLIKKVYVPKYIYPVSRVISSLINFLLALIPLFLVMIITGTGFRPSLLLLVFDIICLTAFSMGMGLILSTAMTFFQDMQFLWGVISMIWMYFTPLFYPESIIPVNIIGIYRLNPLYQFITFARTCIIKGVSPQPIMYLQCILSAMVVVLLGVFIFKKNQDRFILYL
ncbi:MAG: ABC transporter permease [Lachnospiraceae bacterium]|nr:ABC transporter permease [Lachnospiraceae bacterium]